MSISTALRRLALEVLDLVFPPRCAACDLPGESPFCAVCAETLVPTPTGCPVCGVPQDESLLPALKPRRCPHCRAHPPRFTLASAPYLPTPRHGLAAVAGPDGALYVLAGGPTPGGSASAANERFSPGG